MTKHLLLYTLLAVRVRVCVWPHLDQDHLWTGEPSVCTAALHSFRFHSSTSETKTEREKRTGRSWLNQRGHSRGVKAATASWNRELAVTSVAAASWPEEKPSSPAPTSLKPELSASASREAPAGLSRKEKLRTSAEFCDTVCYLCLFSPVFQFIVGGIHRTWREKLRPRPNMSKQGMNHVECLISLSLRAFSEWLLHPTAKTNIWCNSRSDTPVARNRCA